MATPTWKQILAAASLGACVAFAQAHAAPRTHWWIYQQNGNPKCEPLERFVPGHPLHEPADLVAELQREGTDPTWHNFQAKDGHVSGVSVSIMDNGNTYEVDIFDTRDLCTGYGKWLDDHPDETGDRSI
jgi:hypothetical protein